MRRGEVWTVVGGNNYAGKPRPAVIVQDDSFDATDSINWKQESPEATAGLGDPFLARPRAANT
jgi:hypothetical protein